MQSVFCIATSERLAERMLERLRNLEIPAQAVSVIVPIRCSEVQGRLADWWTSADDLSEQELEASLAWLAPAHHVAFDEIGRAVAVGPMTGSLRPEDAPGRLWSSFRRWGLPNFEARRYIAELRAGRILVAVHTAQRDRLQRSEQVFEECAGEDIATAGRMRAA